jgi:hypothetical protein
VSFAFFVSKSFVCISFEAQPAKDYRGFQIDETQKVQEN